jgi:malate dehydrogenase (oxaloacetate-decarboxylating)(NADP+)
MADLHLPKNRLRIAALEYHSMGRKGKIEVVSTKPFNTAKDLSLAYTPGVAIPCLEIEKDPHLATEYTAKGNLVGVITNGSAVLGLGNIGALAGKPVMEGKGILFKKFADIDVFDIELNISDPKKFVEVVKAMEPTFGGINLEDIKAPECFYIEEELKKSMNIPIFHDDQHGTAIISGAGLINALELVKKKIEDIKIVIVGAGAAGIASANLYMKLGAKLHNIFMCDSKGVLYEGRGDEDKNKYKKPFFRKTNAKTLDEIIEGADVFAGFSVKGILKKEMVKKMAKKPLIFAMANPDPEITYEDAKEASPDAIIATGRSDYPNQINNVLGFPYIFRGALDVESVAINDEMQLAAVKALSQLAKEEVPEEVKQKYGNEPMEFGPDYIIPKPFDPRVLLYTASAVAEAAIKTGVAKKKINIEEYKDLLMSKIDWTRNMMRNIYVLSKKNPKKIVFPEGDNHKIIWAASELANDKLAKPILLVDNKEKTIATFEELNHCYQGIEFVEYKTSKLYREYVDAYYKMRQRKGITQRKAFKDMKSKYYFAPMMVKMGYADSEVGGIDASYPYVLIPALEIIGTEKGEGQVVSGMHWIKYKNTSIFITDTAVNVDPNAIELMDIVSNGVEALKRFKFQPRVAMLSYSNFGSVRDKNTDKIDEVIRLAKQRYPDLIIDGPMQANLALDPDRLHEFYPFSNLQEMPNLLVCPDLNSANIAIKLLSKLSSAHIIGPIMEGFNKPVQLVTRSSDVRNIINLATISGVDTLRVD